MMTKSDVSAAVAVVVALWAAPASAQIIVPPEYLFPADEWRAIERRWTTEFAARAEKAFALSNGYLGSVARRTRVGLARRRA